MKKTLLIAAAALAAGIISTQASSVYSQNVVGYINTVTYPYSFNFLTCQVTNSDGSNNVNAVLSGNFKSGGTDIGNPSTNQSVLWVPQPGGGYANYYYYSSNDLYVANGNSPYGPDGWYDGGLSYSSITLPIGSAFFVQNPSSSAITNTFVGNVYQATTTNSIVSGFNALGYFAPLGGTPLDSTNVSLPVYGNDGSETVWIWTGNGNPASAWNNLYYWSAAYLFSLDSNYIADGYVPGWYDGGGSYQGQGSSQLPAVGQGLYLQYTGPSTNWITKFSVQ